MNIYLITEASVKRLDEPVRRPPSRGFLWIDATHAEVTDDASGWRDEVEAITGTRIVDPHLIDAANLGHPSYFDSTQEYEMVVFRGLFVSRAGAAKDVDAEAGTADDGEVRPQGRRIASSLKPIATVPLTFFVCDHALVTVSSHNNLIVNQMRARLLDFKPRVVGGKPDLPVNVQVRQAARGKVVASAHQGRPPSRPEDLMLRLLNAMVDRYLALRQPLTDQLDHWQRELLDPKRSFSNWYALLDARIELRKLENLCEEQHDALQEFRDNLVDGLDSIRRQSAEDKLRNDILLVRANDVMEHVQRVRQHASRLQDSIESAIQLHFSATAHRTNEIVRLLTIITAVFAPLTLITGIFGMNFKFIPGLEHPDGFWVTMIAMVAVTIGLLSFFRRRRVIDQPLVRRRRTVSNEDAAIDAETGLA